MERCLSDIVFDINKPIIGKKGVHYQKLLKDWTKIVGEKLSRYTIPTRISSIKRTNHFENVLYLATNNAAAATELVYYLNVIKEQINLYLGYQYIHQIKLVQEVFNVEREKMTYKDNLSAEAQVKMGQLMSEYNQNDDVKQALEGLAKAILSKKL